MVFTYQVFEKVELFFCPQKNKKYFSGWKNLFLTQQVGSTQKIVVRLSDF